MHLKVRMLSVAAALYCDSYIEYLVCWCIRATCSLLWGCMQAAYQQELEYGSIIVQSQKLIAKGQWHGTPKT